jgi:hypothetical protein
LERLDVVFKQLALVPLIVALGAAPAMAKPTVIAELGTAPLLGTSSSTADMRARVARNEGIMSAAATRLGLTPGEYAQFHAALDSSRVAWVTVPRRLDAMTWQANGQVYVLHDVVIPAGTHGWEVDVPAHGSVLALYMPAKCGNLSLVRKAAPPVVAYHPAPARVAALAVAPPPAPVEAAPAAVAVAPAPAPVPDDAVAAAPPAQVAQTAFPAAPATHRIPFFLAPLLFGLAAFSGGHGSGPIAVPATCP